MSQGKTSISRVVRPVNPLIFELKHGHTLIAELMLEQDKSLDINATDSTNSKTALHYAVAGGFGDIVRKLLARDDIDVISRTTLGLRLYILRLI